MSGLPFAPGSVSFRSYPHDGLDAPGIVAELRTQAHVAVAHGFDGVMTSEHHGGFAGYLPNPMQLAGFLLDGMPAGWAAPCPLLLPVRPWALVAEEAAWLAARFPGPSGPRCRGRCVGRRLRPPGHEHGRPHRALCAWPRARHARPPRRRRRPLGGGRGDRALSRASHPGPERGGERHCGAPCRAGGRRIALRLARHAGACSRARRCVQGRGRHRRVRDGAPRVVGCAAERGLR